jgi:DNA repair exonuclease SbcCD nuclease subunit
MSLHLVVGDLQMKKENLQKCLNLFQLIEQKSESEGLNSVIWLGDMLDKRGLVEIECLNSLYNYFSNSGLIHHVLVGNHDLISLHDKKHSLETLKTLKNVHIYDEITKVDNLLFAPYYKDPNKFIQNIASDADILVCHQGIKEFTIGSGYTENEAVNIGDLSHFKLVLAGHYHTPKNINNVVYLGSPFSHSFGESNEEKRIAILDTSNYTLKYFSVLNFPRHISIEVNCKDQLPLIDDYNYFRIILNGSEEEINEIKHRLIKKSNVKYIFRETSRSNNVAIEETLTNKDKWIKWCKEIKKLDDNTINKGLELLSH